MLPTDALTPTDRPDAYSPDHRPSPGLGTMTDDMSSWDFEEKSSILDEPVLYFDRIGLSSPPMKSSLTGDAAPSYSQNTTAKSDTRSPSPSHFTPPHTRLSLASSASSSRGMSLNEISTSSSNSIRTPPDDLGPLPRRPGSRLAASTSSSLGGGIDGSIAHRGTARVVSAPLPKGLHSSDLDDHETTQSTARQWDPARSQRSSSSLTHYADHAADTINTSTTITAGEQGTRWRAGLATPGLTDRPAMPPSTVRRNLSRFGGPARRAAPVMEVEAEDAQAASRGDLRSEQIEAPIPRLEAISEPREPPDEERPARSPPSTTRAPPIQSSTVHQSLPPAQPSTPLRISPPPVEHPFRPFSQDESRAAIPDSKSFRLIQSTYAATTNSDAVEAPAPPPPQHRQYTAERMEASRPAPQPAIPDSLPEQPRYAPAPMVAQTMPGSVANLHPQPTAPGKRMYLVNGISYERIGVLGTGGTSKVYSVLCPNKRVVYALKRVALERADADTYQSYTNEIALLKRLRGHDRIIQLVDEQITVSSTGRPKTLLMVMECGEIDFSSLLEQQRGRPLNLNFVGMYWEQMLEAVQAVHMENVVHTDLKPANFVLVKGRLKIIDFGIAKAIANDTVNIQRDQQVGTVNYMSPEAIQRMNNQKFLKLSYPSDVWSLGCILYQMIYGNLPFGHFGGGPLAKMTAIANPNHRIDYPAMATPKLPPGSTLQAEDLAVPVLPSAIDTMKRCLMYRKEQRLTIPELLRHEFLRPREISPGLPKGSTTITEQQMGLLVKYILKENQLPITSHHDNLISDLFSQLQAQNSLEQEQR